MCPAARPWRWPPCAWAWYRCDPSDGNHPVHRPIRSTHAQAHSPATGRCVMPWLRAYRIGLTAIGDGGATPCDGGVTQCDSGVATCDDGATPCDDGATTYDGGASTGDGGATPCDDGVTPCDVGATTCDGSSTPCDGGVIQCDVSATTFDGSATTCDGGVTPCDGSATPCDGGVATCDGSATPCDGGATPCWRRARTRYWRGIQAPLRRITGVPIAEFRTAFPTLFSGPYEKGIVSGIPRHS